MNVSRRESIEILGSGVVALTAASVLGAQKPAQQICFFTKMFQKLSFDELAQLTTGLGFGGVEATIRPKGHIEPEAVPDQLPQMVEALKKQGRELSIMASGINSVSPGQHTESVLKTAAALGVKRYRMSYFRYNLRKPLKSQLVEFKAQLKDLVALNQELGIQALYQNHAGKDIVGAPIWDICDLIEEFPREAISLAFDIRHAVVEGGYAWQVNARRAMPLAASVYVKDFVWKGAKAQNVPLGEGRVQKSFFRDFDIANFAGPVSLHVEYVERSAPDVAELGKAAYAKDFETLKSFLR
ncbi:MAG: sugar phosphate isomerase/epimerase [Rhodothermales bacterium]|jgi:sugar phosphate isomerase/epimerase